MIKKLIMVGLGLSSHVAINASVSINMGAELLKTSGSVAMPTTGLVLLTATGPDLAFNGPTDTLFASGDDHIVQAWDLTLNATPGLLLDATPSLGFSGTWNSGQPLGLYWFPTLTVATYNAGAGSPGGGTSYGFFTDATGHNGSAAWVTPLSGTIGLNFYTTDATVLPNPPGSGFFGASVGNASLTTVPEPATYGVVFGVLSLVGGMVLKRRKQS